ncbi:MAG: PEP-CTERM sorting domain-containing protein [Pirellulales bacterium]|nr:PEP-CTERM sorting domain-containing protein [Pirellulales bacterium]
MKRIIFSLCISACVLAAAPTWADYSSDLGALFQADVDAGGGTPTSTTLGDWEFKFPEGSTGTAVGGGIPWSGQGGWCQGDGSACGDSGEYGYFWQELWSLGPAHHADIAQGVGSHGPMAFDFTVPAGVSGLDFSGSLVQLYEASRQLDLTVTWPNGHSRVLGTSAAPLDNSTMFQTKVDYSTFVGNVSEGDVLSLTIGPSASGGNGVNTFIQASITATSAVPEPTSLMLLAMSAVAGLVGFRRR